MLGQKAIPLPLVPPPQSYVQISFWSIFSPTPRAYLGQELHSLLTTADIAGAKHLLLTTRFLPGESTIMVEPAGLVTNNVLMHLSTQEHTWAMNGVLTLTRALVLLIEQSD